MSSSKARHPINYASRLSGVSTHAIRIWERRYGAVKPTRNSAQQRLYSDDEIQRLTLLKRATDAGHPISKLAQMTDNELREILRNASRPEVEDAIQKPLDTKLSGRLEELVTGCCEAVKELDTAKLIRLFAVAHNELPLETMLEHVVSPLMLWVGNAWHDGTIGVAHEHLASATLRAFLDSVHSSVRVSPECPGIVVTTPAAQRHEFGAMLVAITAATEGWQGHYFGPDMPASEIARVATETGSQVVALSAVTKGTEKDLLHELREIRTLLPSETTVVAGGAGVAMLYGDLAETGIRCVNDLSNFRALLRSLN